MAPWEVIALLVAADRVQGELMLQNVVTLIGQGVSEAEAKARVYPAKEIRYESFEQVFLRMLGLPTIITCGSANKGDFGGSLFQEPTKQLTAALSFLGFSHMSGGGPGRMETFAKGWFEAIQIANDLELMQRWKSTMGRVLLFIGKEKPHGFCPSENTTWPIDTLYVRTPMMSTIGVPQLIIVEPGGLGTGEEFFRASADGQLCDHIKTAIPRKIPIVLADYPLSHRSGMFWDGLWLQLQDMAHEGVLRWEEISNIHRVSVTDPNYVREIVTLADQSVAEMLLTDGVVQSGDRSIITEFGGSILQEWGTLNERDLFETVERSVERL